eukprot:440034_1
MCTNRKDKSIIHWIPLEHTDDPTFINNLKHNDIDNIFEQICDQTKRYPYHQLQALNSLFWPRVIEMYPLYERCGLYNHFKKILNESYHLKHGKHDHKSFQIQYFTLHFLAAVIMIKNIDGSGQDGIDETYSFKLLQNTNMINIYFQMISLKYCHLEWVLNFLRMLTLILNSTKCARYIIKNLIISKTLKHLIPICLERIKKSNFCGYSQGSFDAAQGLALQIFYQFEIHCRNLKIRNDILLYLKRNENKTFRKYAYPYAVQSIEEQRCLSIDETVDMLNDCGIDIKNIIRRTCAVCYKDCKKYCSGCKQNWYCCRKHQKQDWKINHRFECETRIERDFKFTVKKDWKQIIQIPEGENTRFVDPS